MEVAKCTLKVESWPVASSVHAHAEQLISDRMWETPSVVGAAQKAGPTPGYDFALGLFPEP